MAETKTLAAGGARTHMLRHISSREEVRDNGCEQDSILNQELGHVAVAHGHDQHHCFIHICTFAQQQHIHIGQQCWTLSGTVIRSEQTRQQCT